MLRAPNRMYVTTDAVAFSCTAEEGLRLLLIRRARPPFEGRWALPGGFVEAHEELPDACVRELKEEAGVSPAAMVQIGAWGKPGRDPRGRTVSVAYLAVVRPDRAEAVAGDDAEQVEWRLADHLPRLAFDHEEIAAAGRERLRSMADSTHIVFGLLPERFKAEDLRDALGAVSGELVTGQETMAFARRARVVKERAEAAREVQLYRCVAPDLLAPLR